HTYALTAFAGAVIQPSWNCHCPFCFVFIDLIISTLLMYLGMMMVPPMILSLPFKILVFVYLGGYTKIVDIMFKTVA
ncbi:hypothetical protein ACT4UL_27645, partial [Bacillus sp. HC-TM]